MLFPTGNRQFDTAAAAADAARVAAMSAATDQIDADAIAIVYFQTVISAGDSFGIATINERAALKDLLGRKYTAAEVAAHNAPKPGNVALRQDGGFELRQDGGRELRQ